MMSTVNMWEPVLCQALCHREVSLEILIFIGCDTSIQNYSRDNWVCKSGVLKREVDWRFRFEGQEHVNDSENQEHGWDSPGTGVEKSAQAGTQRKSVLQRKRRIREKARKPKPMDPPNQGKQPFQRAGRSHVSQMLLGPNKKKHNIHIENRSL